MATLATAAGRPCGPRWTTFLRNEADAIWAYDFLPVTDLLFRPVYACFVVALGSRRVVHVGVTRHPCAGYKCTRVPYAARR